jgi:host factor-I protein
MKDAMPAMPAERLTETEGFANRKLIRPSLNHSNHGTNHSAASLGERRERPADRSNGGPRKAPPPEQTNAESFYYQKQMQSKTPMVIVMADGEEIHGIVEWYDRNCIKVNRMNAPNLMIYKSSIKYAYKEGENLKK